MTGRTFSKFSCAMREDDSANGVRDMRTSRHLERMNEREISETVFYGKGYTKLYSVPRFLID